MAKFCSQCGRPLQEGEVCNCTQQNNGPEQGQSNQNGYNAGQGQPNYNNGVNQQQEQYNNMNGQQTAGPDMGAAGPNINTEKAKKEAQTMWSNILNVFKKPVETLGNIARSNDMKFGIEMIAINAIIYFIIMLIAISSIKSSMGYYAEYLGISTFGISISVLFSALIINFAQAGILFGSIRVLSKDSDATFAYTLTFVGGKTLYDAILIIISAILLMMSPVLGAVVYAVGTGFTYLIFVVSCCETVKMEGSKKVYALTITFAGNLLVTYLIIQVLLGSLLSSLSSILGYM